MGYKHRNIARLEENSKAILKSADPANITLAEGKSMFWVRDLRADSTFKVTTPTAVAAARGTGWVQSSGSIVCFDDVVRVKNVKGDEINLAEDKVLLIGADGAFGGVMGADAGAFQRWYVFTQAVLTDPEAEDFVFVKNEEDKTVVKVYSHLERREYKTTEIDENEFQVRINKEYEPVDKEIIEMDHGLVRKVEIIYADLSGPGSRIIAEIRILTKVAARLKESGKLYGIRFDLSDKHGTLKEEEKNEMPPPMPEPANEAAVSRQTGSGGTAAKVITQWNQVNTSGFGSPANAEIPAMAEFKGFLYAGTTNAGGAQLFRSSNGADYSAVDLTGVAGFAGNLSIRSMAAYPLPESASTRFYIGTAQDSASAAAGSVFVSSDGLTFTDLSGAGKWGVANDGANDSPAVTALIVYENRLYAGVSFARANCEIWRRSVSDDAAAWEQVLTKAQLSAITEGDKDAVLWNFKIFNNKLYAAIQSNAGSGTGPVMLVSATGDSGSWSQAGNRGLV